MTLIPRIQEGEGADRSRSLKSRIEACAARHGLDPENMATEDEKHWASRFMAVCRLAGIDPLTALQNKDKANDRD